MDQGTLVTRRLILEPLRREHAPLLFAGLDDARLWTYLPLDAPSLIGALSDNHDAPSMGHSPERAEIWLNWAISLRGTNIYVGRLEATIYADGNADIAYIVFADFWRQGYAREGCEEVIRHLFAERDVKVITATMDIRNAASIALVEAFGFIRINKVDGDEYHYQLKREKR